MKNNGHIIRNIIVAFFCALIAIIITLIYDGSKISVGVETSLLYKYEALRKSLKHKATDTMLPDALLINVAYDRQLVEIVDEFGIPIGNTDITDREKLIKFLTLLKEANNYRLILLDVEFFENSPHTIIDDSLCLLIKSMEHIIVPERTSVKMLRPYIEEKAAPAEYLTTIWNDRFSKYPLLIKGESTIGLRMFQEISGKTTYTKFGFLRVGKNWWPRTLSLSIPYSINGPYNKNGDKNYYNLGTDVLELESEFPIKEFVKNKVVLIGDFVEYDMHDTYKGKQPGVIIHYNAYRSLIEGRNKYRIIFIVFLWLIYFVLSILQMNNITIIEYIVSHFNIKSYAFKVLLTWLDYTVLFELIFFFLYLTRGEFKELVILSICLTIQKLIIGHE